MNVRALIPALAVVWIAAQSPPARAAQSHGYVVTTDFSTGGLSAVTLATHAVAQDVASVYKDARVRWFGGLLYVVNRLGQDNIQVIDPAAGFATVKQFSTGNGSNPYDIAVVSPTRAYVALYHSARMLIVNPSTGAQLGSIDLSMFADADGLPEPDHIARYGRWLLVSLQRIDENHGFQPTDSSLVAVIDAVADTVVDVDPALPGKQAILLSRTNPSTAFAWDPVGRVFYLGCVGAYGVLDGGVVKIDPATFKDMGVAITEAALGGDIADVEWHTATHGYAIVTDASFNASLVTWNPATGAKLATVFGPNGGLADCALDDRGELYLCDNSFSTPGLRVFSTATDAPLAGPLPTGLPPNSIVFDAYAGDALDAPAPEASIAFAAPEPNPASERVTLRLTQRLPGRSTLEAYDLAGRRLRIWANEGVGTLPVTWDLRDASGIRVKPGVYLLRARVDGNKFMRRVIVL